MKAWGSHELRWIGRSALAMALVTGCSQPAPTAPTPAPPRDSPSASAGAIPPSSAPASAPDRATAPVALVSPSAPPTPTESFAAPTPALPTPPPAPPVDPTITPISRSQPTAAARAALTACGAYERGLDKVARAGRVPHVRDLTSYTLLSPKAPELKLHPDEPAWVVEFQGEFAELRSGEGWIDETCVVIRGMQGFYGTGPTRDLATGQIVGGYATPSADYRWSLPELVP
jgi:hypothetical protein